ncbi:MAG: DUF3256 family protein, partial [Muribaculaceae bacterium]|nr:DUF3256 family protein [Muribaculaceae bacterium]
MTMHFASCIRNCRKWLLLTLCLVASAAGHAAVNVADTLTASKVFAEIPLEVLDMLRPSTRLDMLDYYNQADSLLTVQNALGGESRLEQVAPDYIKVSVTPVSTLEIKLLPYKKGQLVMTLYTVSNMESRPSGLRPVSDTEVKFFDSNLNPLDPAKFLTPPTINTLFNLKNSNLTEQDLLEKIPFPAIAYSTGPGAAPLTATFTSLEALSQ